jgi:hypothetical protein
MHRSGTSAVAGMLVRLGAQAPKTLMPADADNPASYWESSVLCELHERLLHAAGSRWDAFTRLDHEGLQMAASDGLAEECRVALQTEFGDAPRFVLKDPRVCRFVPFWLQILEAEGIAATVVLVLRSPGDVARSLAARNGFEPDLSLLMWLRHVLDAERDTRTIPRTFVQYSNLLERWSAVAERISQDLQLPWPTRSATADVEIDRFVSRGLCHHNGDPDITGVAPVVSDWTRRAWAALGWLHDRAPGQTQQAFNTLNAIRAEFDQNTSVLGDVRDRIHVTLRAEHDALRRHAAGLEALCGGLQRRIGVLEEESSALRGETDALRREAAGLQKEVAAAQAHIEALRKSASWRVTAPLRAVYRIFR